MVCSLYTSCKFREGFRCPCRELSNSTLTLLVRCRFEVLVAILCVPWVLVDAQLLAIPLALISGFFFFLFKLKVRSLLFTIGVMTSSVAVKMAM